MNREADCRSRMHDSFEMLLAAVITAAYPNIAETFRIFFPESFIFRDSWQ